MLTRSLAIACALAGVARAERVVAIAPLSTLDSEDKSASTKKLTGELEAAVAGLGARVVTAAHVAEAIKRANKPQLRACEGDDACLAELGRLVGAQIVIAGQVGGLGEAKVVYLAATDVAAGTELRSTTLAVGTDADPRGPIGAVIRLLDPAKYRGSLRFAIDVAGATVYVNGAKAALSPDHELALPVGTQAVRVTHPEYRDFVRFIDVRFDTTSDVAVGMAQYPIIQRDVRGNPVDRDARVYVDPPWWRRWYVVAPAAVGLAIVTGVVVGLVARDLPDSPCRKLDGQSC